MQDDFTSLHTFVMVQDLVVQDGGTENVSQHFMFITFFLFIKCGVENSYRVVMWRLSGCERG